MNFENAFGEMEYVWKKQKAESEVNEMKEGFVELLTKLQFAEEGVTMLQHDYENNLRDLAESHDEDAKETYERWITLGTEALQKEKEKVKNYQEALEILNNQIMVEEDYIRTIDEHLT